MAGNIWRVALAVGCMAGAGLGVRAQDAGAAPAAEEGQQAEAQRDPRVRDVLRRVGRAYGEVPRLSTQVVAHYTIDEEEQQQASAFEVHAERPNRVSLRYRVDEEDEYALISDGETLHQYVGGELNMYSREDAPETFAGMIDSASMGAGEMASGFNIFMSPHLLMLQLLSGSGLQEIAETAERTRYVGREDLEDVPHEHIRLEGDRLNVDMWIAEGERAWIGRIVADMSPMFESMREMMGEEAEDFVTGAPSLTMNFADWAIPGTIPAEMFAYQAPEGAEEVESIAEGMRERYEADMDEGPGDDGHADLLGHPAPGIDLELLGGGRATIAKDKVVVLDFWATWCPPCVRGLPILQSVADKYKDKDVVFYAVNVREKPDTIRKFMDKQQLSLPVALDADGEAGDRYSAMAIPQTVLIGKDGTVQAVHVGLLPDMEERLTREIDALLKGEALVDPEGIQRPQPDGAGPVDAPELEEVWAVRGRFQSAAVVPGSEDIVLLGAPSGARTKVSIVDRAGELRRSINLSVGQDAPSDVRIARLGPNGEPALVVFRVWGRGVHAFDFDGKKLWEYNVGQGVDDVWPADLDGDGRDEIVIGYNGGTGLHALDPGGENLWKYTGIGNVWHVTAGDLDGDGTPEIITTSAAGGVHTFDKRGKNRRDFSPGDYANMVRFGTRSGGEPVILVGGSGRGSIIGMDGNGKRLWRTSAGQRGHTHWASAVAAHDAPVFAITASDSATFVVDTDSGAFLGQVPIEGRPGIAMARDEHGLLLIIATGGGARALRVAPVDTGDDGAADDAAVRVRD